MRRISLALALLGAVAATGCGGGTNPSSSGSSKGVPGSTFTVKVRGDKAFFDASTATTVFLPDGGFVTAANGLNCGYANGTAQTACKADYAWGTADAPTLVPVTAAPAAPNTVFAFAGACTGSLPCTVSGNADRLLMVRFAPTAIFGHPNLSSADIHGPSYLDFVQGAPGAYQCTTCHGANLLGAGLAVSCATCHSWPLGGHFNAANAPWGDHNGWAKECIRCHTSQGFQDYAGVDGSAGNTTGLFAPTSVASSTTAACTAAGTCNPDSYAYGPLQCVTCHNPTIDPNTGSGQLTTVYWYDAGWATSPIAASTKSSTVDAATGICVQCHQARESGASIRQKIAAKLPTSDDSKFGGSFMNPHYLGAAATVFGAEAGGWVQVATSTGSVPGTFYGTIYTGKNEHGGAGKCTVCHNAHTGELPADGAELQEKCGACHYNEAGARISTFLGLGGIEEVRQFGFEGDVDGDGNATESVKQEIDGVAAQLYTVMQAYAVANGGTITYTDAYPYYTVSTNGWSSRLMRAAANYKWYKAEPGAWAHNPRYVVEVLFDSIADLNAGITALAGTPVVTTATRAFNGHFGAAEDPSPLAAMTYHYYAPGSGGSMGFTSGACYQCHGGKGGFDAYVTGAPAAMASGAMANKVTAMQCSTCHTYNGTSMTEIRSDVATVYFPPQKGVVPAPAQNVVSFAAANLPPSFPLCATCHSGRENGSSIDIAIGATADTSFTLGFKNPHYLGAAGMMLGNDAKMLYQYTGNAYTGAPAFWSLGANGPHGSPHGAKCTGCHNPLALPNGTAHTFEIDLARTTPKGTWGGAYPVAGMNPGAQNTAACNGCHAGPYALAPKALEFEEASAELLTAIQAYATANAASTGVAGVCYNGATNPYWFVFDGTACTATSFAKFNPKLLKAAYNYQWTQKEPGAWAHNEYYVLQAIYDSIVDLGGTPGFTVTADSVNPNSPLNRPVVPVVP
jgi:hypothetical protein